MADLNAGIIGGLQQPNFLATIQASNQAAQEQIAARRQEAMARMMQQNGPGIMNGDPAAMNALAQFDPQAALGIQQSRLNMDATRQDMGFSAERMQMAREQARMTVAEHAARMSAAERETEAAKIEQGLQGAAYFYQRGDRAGYDNFARSHGLDPQQVPFDQFPAVAAQFSGALEALKTFKDMNAPADPTKGAPGGYMWNEPGNPSAGVTQLPGMEPKDPTFRPATSDEAGKYGAAAGQFDSAGRFYPINPPSGMSVEQGPDGQLRITQGPGAGAPPKGEPISYNPTDVDTMLKQIDAIYDDPALERVTGPVAGQGGNDVEQIGMVRSIYYGGKGVALVEKIGQLQGGTWLAARQMLKGGGAITDYESRKAEAAMARLSRVKSDDEFKAALTDLKDAITEGRAKLQAAGKLPAAAQDDASDDDLLRLYGGGK